MRPSPANALNLIGQTFGRLTVLELADGRSASGGRMWRCRCACGTERVVSGEHLRSGHSTSCGCAKRELTRERRRTHGKSNTAEFNIWMHLRRRCQDANAADYPRYGGRGITVCERWQSFENFLADMGSRPSPQHSIDRIDNDGPYSPENCRWATRKEQNRNKRSNVYLTHGGETLLLKDWAARTGIAYKTLYFRHKAGYPPERMLEPLRGTV